MKYLVLLLIPLLLCFSKEVSLGVVSGGRFAFGCLLPTIFPFFIVCDMISAYGLPLGRLGKSKELQVIIPALISGFPHGARMATALYERGAIVKEEYERLLVLSNTPSLAFVVAGVGHGMLGSGALGGILFLSLVLSVVLLSLIKKGAKDNEKITSGKLSADFSLVKSVKDAGTSSITVASFVIFFYGLSALISRAFNNSTLDLVISPLFEVGGACMRISESTLLSIESKMAYIGFALGFSSLSVFMQCSAFTSKNTSRKILIFYKLLQGVFTAFFAFLLTLVFKKWLF